MRDGNGVVKELTELPVDDPRDARIERQDKIILRMRKELEQYRNDLVFWKTAHGHEYPARRIEELSQAIEEINSL